MFRILLIIIIGLSANCSAYGAEQFAVFSGNDGLHLNAGGSVAVYVSDDAPNGVRIAANNLLADIKAVCGADAGITKDREKARIVISTKPDGKWESYVIRVGKSRLEITGSDKRGTIYGIYELSRQIGVSPWYWWADVPVARHDDIRLKEGTYTDGEPAVKYRGIFINDEFPSMTAWAREKFGGLNSKMYAHLYELLLRLKANCLWPAMWGSFKEYKPLVPILKDAEGRYEGNCFNEDDPLNPKTADEWGIVIGTSHHEPMQRSQQEWIRNKQNYGNAQWNWMTNREGVKKFFREGIENTKNYESLITIGMRGEEDCPMTDAGSIEANFRLMEDILSSQRRIIKDVTGRPAAQTPQVWTLYSEVMDYYDKGLKVPDDVTIMLCDDNFGHVRRVPSLTDKKRKGGYGMYYHVGYYGAPRANKWLTMQTITEMWEQLKLTYDYGVRNIWILNVGDVKPHEYPIDFFMEMAWHPETFRVNNLKQYTSDFCMQQFGGAEMTNAFGKEAYGKADADETADMLMDYCRYASRVTAELLDTATYNLQSGEWKAVRDEFLALETRALRQYITLADSHKDAYKQLVLFPIQAMANLYDMYYSQAMNKQLAALNDREANVWAERVEKCYARDSMLCYDYNRNIAGGKWNHMMDQVHIGYDDWHARQFNRMPEVKRVSVKDGPASPMEGVVYKAKNGVAVMEADRAFEYSGADAPKAGEKAEEGEEKAVWTVIPGLGRTRCGVSLMPYTSMPDGAWISYSYESDAEVRTDSIDIHVVFAATMPFIPGGHTVSVSLDGGSPVSININHNFNWDHKYDLMYPTGCSRVNEVVFRCPNTSPSQKRHVIRISHDRPGVVVEKVIADLGGYEQTRLGMMESEVCGYK
ncbi:MAG: glycosyl hydrolase 115 family protein [Bacteroidaceae bacterium]|nr:glycosyl hydrolase 115 family protein [Bacteroidaceae bacterium]